MDRERLEHGKKVLEALRARGVCEGMKGKKGHADALEMETWGKTDCGTVACIGGWFTLDPEFQRQGLQNSRGLGYGKGLELLPRYQDETSYDALGRFFELTPAHVQHIFDGGNSSNFEDALARIDAVLNGWDDEALAKQVRAQRAGWRGL